MSEVIHKYLPKYTYDDYKNWEGKWELINGIPYAMSPAPRIEDQEVSLNISLQLKNLLKSCKICKVLQTIDWKLTEGEGETVLQPDSLVICKDVKGNFITDAPEMIFEILSPSTAIKDKIIKYNIYESQLVKYYIIVDIDNRIAEVFRLGNGKFE